MESILTNLIENSLKYSTTKNINIELGKSDKKSYFKLYNGIGDINEDIKYKLLEPFIKGRTNDSEISSSGLGLYICKRLCEKNDLKIDYYIENGFIKFIITIN